MKQIKHYINFSVLLLLTWVSLYGCASLSCTEFIQPPNYYNEDSLKLNITKLNITGDIFDLKLYNELASYGYAPERLETCKPLTPEEVMTIAVELYPDLFSKSNDALPVVLSGISETEGGITFGSFMHFLLYIGSLGTLPGRVLHEYDNKIDIKVVDTDTDTLFHEATQQHKLVFKGYFTCYTPIAFLVGSTQHPHLPQKNSTIFGMHLERNHQKKLRYRQLIHAVVKTIVESDKSKLAKAYQDRKTWVATSNSGSYKQLKRYVKKHPKSVYTTFAKKQLKGISQERAIKRKKIKDSKRIEKKIKQYIAQKNLYQLKKIIDQDPDILDLFSYKALELCYIGPPELKIGDIHRLIKKGRSEKIIISLINRTGEPYKQFSLDEIDTLVQLGLKDNIIAAMMEVSPVFSKPQTSGSSNIASSNKTRQSHNIRFDNNGIFMSPFSRHGTPSNWVMTVITERQSTSNTGQNVGNAVGSAVGRYAARKALEQVPFGGLLGGLVGGAVGEKVGEEVTKQTALNLAGGMQSIRYSSDCSFDSLQDMAKYMMAQHSSHPQYNDVLNIAFEIYPQFKGIYYQTSSY